jgi:hypothetical protein
VTTISPLLKKPANPVGSLFGFFKNDSNWMISIGSLRSFDMRNTSSPNAEAIDQPGAPVLAHIRLEQIGGRSARESILRGFASFVDHEASSLKSGVAAHNTRYSSVIAERLSPV